MFARQEELKERGLRKVATTDFVRELDPAQLSDFHVYAFLPEFHTAHKDGNFFYTDFLFLLARRTLPKRGDCL